MFDPNRRKTRGQVIEQQAEMTIIVRTLIRALLPLLLVFGFYIISYGHLTPGGGFQGGMIVVGAVMSFYLAYGYNIVRRFHEEDLDIAEHLLALTYILIGLIGKDLHPLSHVVQAMRKTRQTREFIVQMGPFFVGRVVARTREAKPGASAHGGYGKP